jgi:hypothetical protein
VKLLAPRVWRLKQFPAPTVNIYLVEVCEAHGIPLAGHTDEAEAMGRRNRGRPRSWSRPR